MYANPQAHLYVMYAFVVELRKESLQSQSHATNFSNVIWIIRDGQATCYLLYQKCNDERINYSKFSEEQFDAFMKLSS